MVSIKTLALQAAPSTGGLFNVNLPLNAPVVAPANLPSANAATAQYAGMTSLVAYDNLGNQITLDVYSAHTGVGMAAQAMCGSLGALRCHAIHQQLFDTVSCSARRCSSPPRDVCRRRSPGRSAVGSLSWLANSSESPSYPPLALFSLRFRPPSPPPRQPWKFLRP